MSEHPHWCAADSCDAGTGGAHAGPYKSVGLPDGGRLEVDVTQDADAAGPVVTIAEWGHAAWARAKVTLSLPMVQAWDLMDALVALKAEVDPDPEVRVAADALEKLGLVDGEAQP